MKFGILVASKPVHVDTTPLTVLDVEAAAGKRLSASVVILFPVSVICQPD